LLQGASGSSGSGATNATAILKSWQKSYEKAASEVEFLYKICLESNKVYWYYFEKVFTYISCDRILKNKIELKRIIDNCVPVMSLDEKKLKEMREKDFVDLNLSGVVSDNPFEADSSDSTKKTSERSSPKRTRSQSQSSEKETPAENPACTICLLNFEPGDQYRKIKCNHIFHKECLDHWLNTSGKKTCPFCRASVHGDYKVPTNHYSERKTLKNLSKKVCYIICAHNYKYSSMARREREQNQNSVGQNGNSNANSSSSSQSNSPIPSFPTVPFTCQPDIETRIRADRYYGNYRDSSWNLQERFKHCLLHMKAPKNNSDIPEGPNGNFMTTWSTISQIT